MEAGFLAWEQVLAYRLLGAAGGAFLGIVIVWPSTWAGFLQRATASAIAAITFAPIVRWYFEWLPTPDNIVAAAALSGCFFWHVAHAIIKALDAGWFQFKRQG